MRASAEARHKQAFEDYVKYKYSGDGDTKMKDEAESRHKKALEDYKKYKKLAESEAKSEFTI